MGKFASASIAKSKEIGEANTHVEFTPLHNQATLSCRHQLFKDLRKVSANLLKRPLNCFVLALVESNDEFLNRVGRRFEFALTFDELVSLFRKARILPEESQI